jgi:hypothetical protein
MSGGVGVTGPGGPDEEGHMFLEICFWIRWVKYTVQLGLAVPMFGLCVGNLGL